MFVLVLSLALAAISVLTFLAARGSGIGKTWMLAPTGAFAIYFLAVGYGGVVLSSADASNATALLAHIEWFCGLLAGLMVHRAIASASGVPAGQRMPQRLVGRTGIFWFFIVLGVLSVLTTFYFYGRIPLLTGLSGIFDKDVGISMHQARRMNTLNHRAGDTVYFGQGYLRQLYTVVAPVYCVALYLLIRSRHPLRGKRFLTLLFCSFVVFAALNGQIWPAVQTWLFFLMAVVFVMVRRSSSDAFLKVVRKGVWIYILLLGFIFAYRYFQQLQGREFQDFFLDTIRRIYGYEQVDLFQIFPRDQEFRGGATWLGDIRGVLPGSTESFAYEVHWLVHGGGWGYTLSPGIVASSYVNFGHLGCFVAGTLLGLVFTRLYCSLIAKRNAVAVAVAVFLSYRFAMGVPGDFGVYVVDAMTGILIVVSYSVLDRLLPLVARSALLSSR